MVADCIRAIPSVGLRGRHEAVLRTQSGRPSRHSKPIRSPWRGLTLEPWPSRLLHLTRTVFLSLPRANHDVGGGSGSGGGGGDGVVVVVVAVHLLNHRRKTIDARLMKPNT